MNEIQFIKTIADITNKFRSEISMRDEFYRFVDSKIQLKNFITKICEQVLEINNRENIIKYILEYNFNLDNELKDLFNAIIKSKNIKLKENNASIDEIEHSLNNLGITTKKPNGVFKSTNDVFSDLAKTWEKLDKSLKNCTNGIKIYTADNTVLDPNLYYTTGGNNLQLLPKKLDLLDIQDKILKILHTFFYGEDCNQVRNFSGSLQNITYEFNYNTPQFNQYREIENNLDRVKNRVNNNSILNQLCDILLNTFSSITQKIYDIYNELKMHISVNNDNIVVNRLINHIEREFDIILPLSVYTYDIFSLASYIYNQKNKND